jgi:hypothetical protein
MKRLPRNPIRFDIVHAFADFGRVEKVSLRDPTVADGFIKRTRASIDDALSNEQFLQGIRTERMFESLVASLGAIDVLKQEDAGEIYVSDETLRVPDFRLVLADGSQMLVEVKNYFQKNDAMRLFELDQEYLEGLVRYAKTMNSTLQIAVYWAAWNIWTLVRPEVFKKSDGKYKLAMMDAMRFNHMASLGDFRVGTRFPLSLIMYADKEKPRSIQSDGSGQFTTSKVEIYSAGHLVADPLDRQIATTLMFYGRWEYEVEPRISGAEIDAVEHRWIPEEDNDQGFEIVDSLSGMFSNFYRFATQDEDKIAKLKLDVAPGSWGSIIPKGYAGKDLPLWVIIQEASPFPPELPAGPKS